MKRLWKHLLSYPAAIFYLSVASMLAPQTREEIGALLSILAGWTFHSAVASWLMTDARRFGLGQTYDHDTFLACTWPIAGPIQLLRTRGWRGFFPIGAFALITASGTSLGYFLSRVGD